MRRFESLWLAPAIAIVSTVAYAQDVRIVSPAEGADVRGEITAQFEGIPAGGYAVVKVDGNFVAATAQNAYQFDTISDRNTFPRGDGSYKLEITVMNQGGKRVGSATSTFNVANSIPKETGEAVRLTHWQPADRLSENVQRYRIFAESSANVLSAQAGGGGGGAGGGGEAGGVTYVEAPLDWQVTALLRRVLRDTNMVDGAANVRTIVQESFERQRAAPEADPNADKKRRRGARATSIVMKAPWSVVWTKAAETGQTYVKMIQANGTEINATRKAPTIAIGDLLPTFPETPIRPGATWETTMTILGELSSRTPLNVRAPITFTSFETLQTPAGDIRECAKLESRFRLPETLAKKIAVGLENQAGRTAGQSTGMESGGGTAAPTVPGTSAGTGTGALVEEDIDLARSDVSRVLWFDIRRGRVLRSEDSIRSYYETLVEAASAPAAAPAGGDAGAAEAEPKKVSYNLNVTTWFDDRIPPVTDTFNAGVGTAHARDNVTDPPLSRILRPTAGR